MALTQKQREELRNKYVGNPNTSVGTSRVDRLRALNTPEPVTPGTTPKIAGQEEEKDSFFSRLKERGSKTLEDLKGTFKRTVSSEQTPVETAVQTVGEAASFVTGTAFDALATVIGGTVKAFTPDQIEEQFGKAGNAFLNSPVGQAGIDAISKGVDAYDKFKAENPRAAANLEGIAGVAEILPTLKAGSTGVKSLSTAAKSAKSTLPKAAAEGLEKRAVQKATRAVESRLIGPMNKKEIRLAYEEGRLTNRTGVAKKLGLRDKVAADEKVKKAAQTLAKRNPEIAKMTDQEIAEFAKKEISTIAKQVEPKLRQVEVPENLIADAVDSYTELKRTQLASEVANKGQVRRLQNKFETFLEQSIDAENADEIWKLVQEFDRTVSSPVKSATTQSAESTQELKNMWLDQRRILRDVLDESVAQTDDSVVTQFREMSDLYTARQNIINAARFEKGRSSFGKQLLTGTLGGGLATGLGLNLLID